MHIVKTEDFGFDNKTIRNTDVKSVMIRLKRKQINVGEKTQYCKIRFRGEVENAGGYLVVNDDNKIPINSVAIIEVNSGVSLGVKLVVAAESAISIEELIFEELAEKEDLTEQCDGNNNVLVIVPNYPSYVNLYLCAFAHSRNREYVKKGIQVQVVSVSEYNQCELEYAIDDVPVLQGTYETLKKLLVSRKYKTIVAHFVEEHLFSVFDGYVYPTDQMIFICHGPEATYRYLENIARPYFTKPLTGTVFSKEYAMRDAFIKRYSQMDNVEWVFVSEWLKKFAEEQQNLEFKHSRIISNTINEELFPYKPKNADDRKKILILRKFDNIMVHSVDQSIRAILALSKREFFEDLIFEIYGDGNYYEVLTEPIRKFKNVHFHRTFIPNEKISQIHEKCGILLIPSRHDTQGVAMGEASSSGLVVVGSNVTCLPYFMQQEKYHTLANPENPNELADIIERLYNNPDEYLRISRELSKFTRNNLGLSQTVDKEIKLIKEKIHLAESEKFIYDKKAAENPVLSIVVPAYNVEQYLEKCIITLLNHPNSSKSEIIIVNDGSTDNTLNIAKRMEKIAQGVVKVIDKKNGGHGSTINEGLKNATGKYFRLIDGDDWVNSEDLSKLIGILEKEEADLVLTRGSYAYYEKSLLENIIDYDMMIDGENYRFEDMIYQGYGFKNSGPLLSTSNYKTKLLQQAGFQITEKKPYVDMEFNAFSIKCIETVKYYDLDIYRYLIGREGQTVSKAFWEKKYKDHEYIIFNILKNIYHSDFSDEKKQYVYKYIVAPMVDSQIFMYDAVLEWEAIDVFLEKLKKKYPKAFNESMLFIENKKGNCQLILKKYKTHRGNTSIVVPGKYETVEDDFWLVTGIQKTFKWYLKKGVKFILPYGIVRYIAQKRNK